MSSQVESAIAALNQKAAEGNTGNNNDVEMFEDILSKEIQKTSNCDSFYKLPMKYIASIVNKADFKNVDNALPLIQQIILKSKKEHEDDYYLLIQSIRCKDLTMTLKDCIDLFACFSGSPLCNELSTLYQDSDLSPTLDYSYEIQRKKEELRQLKEYMAEHNLGYFRPIVQKPQNFESDLHKACEAGNLPSVQWILEKEKIDSQLKKDGLAPIHVAALNDRYNILQYLIIIQHNDKDMKADNGFTPLHYACQKGSIQIAKYLIEVQNANIEAESQKEETPLHIASMYGHAKLVKYLLKKGADKSKTTAGKTPLLLACACGNIANKLKLQKLLK